MKPISEIVSAAALRDLGSRLTSRFAYGLVAGAALIALLAIVGHFAPPSAAQAPLINLQARQPFTLSLSTDKAKYSDGERLTIIATTAKACELTVLDIDPTGSVWRLYPNTKMPNPSIAAGATVFVTGGSGTEALVFGPAGVEQLIAVCTAVESAVDVQRLSSPGGVDTGAVSLTIAPSRSDTAMAVARFDIRP